MDLKQMSEIDECDIYWLFYYCIIDRYYECECTTNAQNLFFISCYSLIMTSTINGTILLFFTKENN